MNLIFVDLLQSQQDTSVGVESPSIPFLSTQATSVGVGSLSIPFLSTQATEGRNFEHNTPSKHKERRTWTPTDDVVLISSWLNTSKDPLVGNEQRSIAFWKRVAAYFAASPKLSGCEKREPSHCKQRWHKINDLVSKFSGAYEAATREKSSGKNENDVIKLAHKIFFTNHNKKFTMFGRSCKITRSGVPFPRPKMMAAPRRGSDEGSQSASSQANETDSAIDDEGSNFP
ncbi:hypothetical protein DY000_02018235 [Brassica cretica]|uniref:Myb-like domain-containing protein n=1 Tax=Brassica cretica TaxID=69181 RepID=A0ABQ7CVN9_BRACR|nr:hypothetical protein DY000_02018235 [Brassica cretica]